MILGLLALIGSTFEVALGELLQILVIPAVIAGGGIWFNQQQRQRELYLTEQRAQDDALEAYMDQMSQLLADKDRPLHGAEQGTPMSVAARARTLATLQRVDGARQGNVVQFLYESGLISKDRRVISLGRANLMRVDLMELHLNGADFRGATLEYATLRNAKLVAANLTDAFLPEADLRAADLSGAVLRGAILDEANLCSAILKGADLSGTSLYGALLHPPDLHLKGVNRLIAFLSGYSSRIAFLRRRYGEGADLSEADLSGADLTHAEITEEQLAKCRSLEGATMPDGSKHP